MCIWTLSDTCESADINIEKKKVISSSPISVQPWVKTLDLTWTMYTHQQIPCWAHAHSNTEVGTVDRRCRAPLPKALLIGIKVFWWGRLLIRLERHASQMWRLYRPAQGRIDQRMAILSVYVCLRLCVFVCLSLVITLKTSSHWLEKGSYGSPWPHSDMSSVGGKDMVGSWQWTLCSSHDTCQTKIENAIDKACYNSWAWTSESVASLELVVLVV